MTEQMKKKFETEYNRQNEMLHYYKRRLLWNKSSESTAISATDCAGVMEGMRKTLLIMGINFEIDGNDNIHVL